MRGDSENIIKGCQQYERGLQKLGDVLVQKEGQSKAVNAYRHAVIGVVSEPLPSLTPTLAQPASTVAELKRKRCENELADLQEQYKAVSIQHRGMLDALYR